MIFIFLYCREKAHDNKNSVVKIQNLDMSQESETIKSNPGALKTSRNEKSYVLGKLASQKSMCNYLKISTAW